MMEKYLNKLPLILFLLSLLLRTVLHNLEFFYGPAFHIPRYIYTPVHFILLIWALYLERERIEDFFISFNNFPRILGIGFGWAVIYCVVDFLVFDYLISEKSHHFHGEGALYLPLFFVIQVLTRSGMWEELLYRSLCLGYLNRYLKNFFLANVIQSCLFTIAHVKYFMPSLIWPNIISCFVLAFVCGLLTQKYKSVVPAIILHSLYNIYFCIFIPVDAAFWQKLLSSYL